jgi:peroxiredoxin Q/BCP
MLQLPAIDGSMFDTTKLTGSRYLLAFFRFASCPFCNMRMHELVTRYHELGDGFGIVAVFDSPLDNLRRHAMRHDAPFPVLADTSGRYYREFGIEQSVTGVMKGILLRMPTLIRGIQNGYLPLRIRGSLTTMPADLLVDESGVIRTAHYGRDEGDHLDFGIVKAFATA